MEEKETMIQIDNVSKVYKLGEIGGTTLTETFQRLFAKLRHKEDPTKKIGAKNYNKGEKFKALDGINLTIKKGERVGIIGHNGAGKSTLLKLICRITAPTIGEIGLNGRITSMLEVGTGFHPELTGRENIYMNGAILGMTKKEIDGVIEDIIEFSEVREFIDTPVKRYSSGMYVKLAFSVASHLKSEIMIMDEVLAVGDIQFQKKCLIKMRDVSMRENRTILYVSHNMNTIRDLCDRVIVLRSGHIVFDGDVEAGIRTYLTTKCDNEMIVKYNLETIKRNERFPDQIMIKSLEFVGKEVPIFERGEKINVRMSFISLKPINNQISIRFQVYLDKSYKLGSVFLNSSFSVENKTDNVVYFELDTTNFIPASYSCDTVIFATDGFGNARACDIVPNYICFEIVQKASSNELVWWREPFGNVKFNDMTLISLEKRKT